MLKKPRRWKGRLAKPIRPQVVRPRGLRVLDAETVAKANEEMAQLIQQAVDRERFDKLRLLAKDYGVADDDFLGLAMALAIEHVPGFRADPTPLKIAEGGVMYASTVGRPAEWTTERLDALLDAVEGAKKKHGLSTDREALATLAACSGWAPPANHRGRDAWIETLESRLQVAKKSKREFDKLPSTFKIRP
jgi:hypothetical protein